jgi:hypothetical protein
MIRLRAASLATPICDEVTTYPDTGRIRTNYSCSFSVFAALAGDFVSKGQRQEGREHSRL